MGREIERKFLVNLSANELKLQLNEYRAFESPDRIAQGYIHTGNPSNVVRVRLVNDKGLITLKAPLKGIIRYEFEYEIPYEDAKTLMDTMCSSVVQKTRYHLRRDPYVWEIDIFHRDNEGLILAEIELPEPNTVFAKPDFIGREVTKDRRFLNAELARYPYKEWADEQDTDR